MATIKITGLKELKKDLKKLGEKKALNIMTSALRAGANEISKTAKKKVPIDSGDLKRSIGVTKRKTPKTMVRFTVSPRVNQRATVSGRKRTLNQANYALNVEYGTRFQIAQPFMRPTFDQLGQNVTNAITKKVAQRIEKEAK